jgi:NHLM bacteriocin system ABC transporter ATP-binding protein
VFSIPVENGHMGGPRRFLWSVDAGESVLGFGRSAESGMQLLAVCTAGTRLRELQVARVREIARKPGAMPEVGVLLESAVRRMAAAAESFARPQLAVPLRTAETARVELGQKVGPVEEFVWVRVDSGTCSFAGRSGVTVAADPTPIPMSRGLWLEATSDAVEVTALDTMTCLTGEMAFEGLSRLRGLLHTWAVLEAKEEEEIEAARLNRRSSAGRRMWKRGLAELATILSGPTPEIAMVGEESDLVAACRLVGEPNGIEFKSPPAWESTSRARDPLAAMCRASRVRTRRVNLRPGWWKHDNGNLLAFLEKEERPVALRREKSGYKLLDPKLGTEEAVTPELAKQLNWEAYTFYKPFPDKRISGKDLLRRIRDEQKGDLRFVLFMALLAGLLQLLVPMATREMFGKVVPNAEPSNAWKLLFGLIGVHLGVAIFNLARAFTIVRIEGKSNASLQAAVVDRMLALSVPFFRQHPVGDLAMRALSINQARMLLSGAASTTILSGLFSILQFILLVYYDWRLSILALVVLLVSLLFVVLVSIPAIRYERENLAVQGKSASAVFEMISGIAKLRVAGAEMRMFSNWAIRFKQQVLLNIRSRSYQNVVKVFNELLPLLSSLALFGTAGYLVRNEGHTIDTADFIAFNTAFGALFAALVQMSDTVTNIMKVRPVIERAAPILESVPEVEAAKADPGELTGRIEADHLAFRYRPDLPLVLDDVSFHAEPGEYIAMVGPSGSGKSTVLRLLLGFELPSQGVIYYDNQDLTSVDVSGVRSQIGVVLQNSRLISGSVFDNVVGSAPLSMDDAWEAAEMSGLANDIKDMPMGMHTVVAEGGANLSGGQQQRLLISRALVRKPRIIFFDEATSALDNRVQEVVSKSLDRLNATRIVIAHRLSTIRNANRIYVMAGGRVVQHGTFEDLSTRPGMFADLIARQQL